MHKLKAVALITFLISALTCAVLFFSQDISLLPPQFIESEHARVHALLKDKLLNAEESLMAQSLDLASTTRLVQELGDVRDKLLITTPEELKKQTSNKWNTAVFDQLINWKQTRDSAIKQADASIGTTMNAENGNMSSQILKPNWWKRSPDLLLAFAGVPMKDGSVSSMLVAYGMKGKELRAGKRYDEDAEMLAEVSKSKQPIMGQFAWDGKMYIAVVAPVMNDGNYVGSVVVGIEVAKEIIDTLHEGLPGFVDLMLIYSSPKFGDPSSGKPTRRFFHTVSEDILRIIEQEKFHTNSLKDQATLALAYDQVQPNLVYVSQSDKKNPIAFSRMRWIWNPVMRDNNVSSEETDIYVITNFNRANEYRDQLQLYTIMAGVITLLLGIILAVLLINSLQKSTHRIKKAIADAINSGDPIDPEAMGLLMGEEPDALPPYTIHEVAEDNVSLAEQWDNMMDMDNGGKQEEPLAPEEIARLENSANADEAKSLYEEYMKKRRENGIDAPMEFDVFLRRLQRNAAKIKETYKCDHVTFQVHVNNGNVVLKPKINK